MKLRRDPTSQTRDLLQGVEKLLLFPVAWKGVPDTGNQTNRIVLGIRKER